jgi:hypothetical protein
MLANFAEAFAGLSRFNLTTSHQSLIPLKDSSGGKPSLSASFHPNTAGSCYAGPAMPLKQSKSEKSGSYYGRKSGAIETWDYILSHGLGFLEGNIVKYVTRYKQKNGREDLLKALDYLNKLLETVE